MTDVFHKHAGKFTQLRVSSYYALLWNKQCLKMLSFVSRREEKRFKLAVLLNQQR